MLKPVFQNKCKKSLKLCEKRNYDISLFDEVAKIILTGKPLPKKYMPHKLTGEWDGRWDCHIKDDWVLIYRYDFANGNVIFEDTGTHSDLF